MATRIRSVRHLARQLGCRVVKVRGLEMPARAGDYRLRDAAGATIEAPLAEIEMILMDEIEVESSDGILQPRDGRYALDDSLVE